MNKLSLLYPKAKPSTRFTGFAKKFLPANKRRNEFAYAIAHWNKKRVLTAMGVINGLVYATALQSNAIYRDEEKGIRVKQNRLSRLVQSGCNVLKTSIKGLQAYLSTHWSMAPSHRDAIYEVRDMLHGLRLIKAVKTKQKSYSWSVFLDIDFAGLLVLYEILEDILLNYWRVPFEELPGHKGALIKILYDATNQLLGKLYRRKLPEGAVGRDVYGNLVFVDKRQSDRSLTFEELEQQEGDRQLPLNSEVEPKRLQSHSSSPGIIVV